MGKQKYSKEFREQAISLIRQGEQSLKEISRTLGVSYWTIREWKEQDLPAFHAETKPRNEKEELRRMRREIQDLRMENAILKKFAAILSKDQQ